jgi:hypothetical protein
VIGKLSLFDRLSVGTTYRGKFLELFASLQSSLEAINDQDSVDTLGYKETESVNTDEIIQHLTSLNGARVKVTLEIEAEIPDGAPSNVVRTVE